MNFSDETLMAYADGELDDAARADIERALRADPALAERVAQHQALRSDVFAAFAPILEEPVPPALTATALPDKVADLNAARAARAASASAASTARRWSWPEWGAIAATLAVGVLAGHTMLGGGDATLAVAARGADGKLVAQGQLASALSQQLAADQGAVHIGVSFAAKDGSLCRSFTMDGTAGLACRSNGQWQLPVMAESAAGAAGDYRQAGSAMPSAVLDAIDARIAGQTLDAQAEQTARQHNWQAQPAH